MFHNKTLITLIFIQGIVFTCNIFLQNGVKKFYCRNILFLLLISDTPYTGCRFHRLSTS